MHEDVKKMSEEKKAPAQNEIVEAAAKAIQEQKAGKADKADKPAKKAPAGKMGKIIEWFKNLPARISKPFKNMYYELKKVTWPSKKKLINYSVIVLAFMLFMGIVIGLLDMGATALINLLM